MKENKTYLFIAISSIALVIVLIIQVNWIFETAKIKEQLFNEKENMVHSNLYFIFLRFDFQSRGGDSAYYISHVRYFSV